jgi:hypothetical protein
MPAQDTEQMHKSIVELQGQLLALTCDVASLPDSPPLQAVRNLTHQGIERLTDTTSKPTIQLIIEAAHKSIDFIAILHSGSMEERD